MRTFFLKEQEIIEMKNNNQGTTDTEAAYPGNITNSDQEKQKSLTKENQGNPIILTLHSPGYSKDNLTLIKDGDNLQFKEKTRDSTLTIEHFFSKNQSVNLRLETDSTQMYKLDQKVKDYLVKNEASHSTDVVKGSEKGVLTEVSFSALFPGDGDSYTYSASQTRHYADFTGQKLRITLTDTGLLKQVYSTNGNNIRTTVEGTTSDNVYHYNLSDGPLFIIDHSGGPQGKKGGGTDTLILNSGITVDDIRLVRSGEDFNWGRNTETSADLKLEILSRDKKTVIGGITLSMHFDKTFSTEIEKLVVGNQTFNLNSLGDSLLPLQENNHQVSLREAIRDGAVTEEKKISQSVIQSGGVDLLKQNIVSFPVVSEHISQTQQDITAGNGMMSRTVTSYVPDGDSLVFS